MVFLLGLTLYALVGLVVSVMLTIHFARNPYNPPYDELEWKSTVAAYSVVWPTLIIIGFIEGARWLHEKKLFGKIAPWAKLYNKIQEKK